MTLQVIDGADATGANAGHLPRGLGIAALYVTGQGDVPATPAELAAYPDALRIAQWPVLGVDEAAHADILDFEDQAATAADIAPWAVNAAQQYADAVRPGQRFPAVYASLSRMDEATSALAAGGAPSATGLVVADWTGNRGQAISMLGTKLGGYFVVGVQYANMGAFDVDVFDAQWVNARSARPAVQPPPGQWHDPAAWTWQEATIVGVGLNGKLCAFEYRPGAPWARVI
jgi:hypothetical protein